MIRYNIRKQTDYTMIPKVRKVEPGTFSVDKRYSITVDPQGPYLVYGNPHLQQQFIIPDKNGDSWEYRNGEHYSTQEEPTALCRCGSTKNAPYCDGSHLKADWNPTLTADNIPALEQAEVFDGPALQLTDNPKFCALARFCDANGQVWNLVENSDNPEAAELTIREVIHCPAGRLKIWDKEKNKFIEPHLEPAIGLIEDPEAHCSGPLWVKGGIPVNSANGKQYELRNRITLCRCGGSLNKPYCDGSHIRIHYQDDLPAPDTKV